jgi:diphthine synthase
METVTFVGLGLNNENSITVEGLEEARNASAVFTELYTSPMTNLDLQKLETTILKPISILTREDLEENSGKKIIDATQHGNVVFLVPGDPMVATTHVSLRLILARKNIETRIIHGQSIISAVVGATGLQNYKFGKSISLPAENVIPQSILIALLDNTFRGLHTLIFLDPATDKIELTINEAIRRLIKAHPEFTKQVAIGAARIGSKDQRVRAGKMGDLVNVNFGPLPHCLVVPGILHFMEVEALETFCGLDRMDVEVRQPLC